MSAVALVKLPSRSAAIRVFTAILNDSGAERMERAQILRESRERVVLKTLRGWIMSVPVAAKGSG